MSAESKLDSLIEDVADLRVVVAKCSAKLDLLDEVRADQRRAAEDLTSLKAKAALVAGAVASGITALGHLFGSK